MQLSVIIPSYRRPELLKKGLESLSKQEIPYSYEVIVLNEGLSNDGTEEICKEYQTKLNLKYYFTGQRNLEKLKFRCPSFAINIGVNNSKGEILILSSPEIFIIEKDTIKQMVEPLLKDSKRLTIPFGKDESEKRLISKSFDKNEDISKLYDKLSETLNTNLPFFMGINKKEFLAIGGYDETFTGYCWDDTDLVDRLMVNGCYYYQVQAHVVHLYHNRRNREGLVNKIEAWLYNRNLYEKKKQERKQRNFIKNNYISEPPTENLSQINKLEQQAEPVDIQQKEPKQEIQETLYTKIIKKIKGKDEPERKYKASTEMVSIIMTSFNRAIQLNNSLYSIINQKKPDKIEIVIVDDGSTDNTKEIVNKYQQEYPEWNIRYIYHYKQNCLTNPSIALNIALIYAKGDIIIQSGADLIHVGNIIEGLLNSFYEDEAYYATRLSRLRIELVNKIPKNNYEKMITYVDKHGWKQNIKPKLADKDKQNALPFCAIYRKEWAYKIGLFDEDYLAGGAEDRDFVYRLQEIKPTRWCNNLWVCHQDHKKYNGEPYFWYGYDKNYLRSFNVAEGRDNRWRKKILFIGNFNLFPFDGYLWDSLKQSFMRLGHYCKFFDPQEISITNQDLKEGCRKSAKIWGYKKTLNKAQDIVEEFKPDVIVSGTGAQWDLMTKLNTNALKIAWFGDLRDAKEYKKYKNKFDGIFLTNEGLKNEWEKILKCSVFPLAFSVLDTGHYERKVEKSVDVGFIGKNHFTHENHDWYKNRMSLLKEIDKNFNLKVLTDDWAHSWEFFSKCKIVISDSCDRAQEIQGYTSNRFFNIMGCGSFCLVRRFPGLEFWGEDGKHFVSFDSNQDALKKIEYYLNHDKERKEIANAGYRWFHLYHNWIDRAKYMSGVFKYLMEKKKNE